MGDFMPGSIQRTSHYRYASGCRYSEEHAAASRRKENDVLGVPGAPSAVPGVAECLRTAPRQTHLPELALSKKSDITAIGRPEGIRCAFSARQRAIHERIEKMHPKDWFTLLARCRKHKLLSV